MTSQLQNLSQEFKHNLKSVSDLLFLEKFEQKYFSRATGEFTKLMKTLGAMEKGKRQEFGRAVNETKNELEKMLAARREELKVKEMGNTLEREAIDVTQPQLPLHEKGHRHPITLIENELVDLFASMGFIVEDTPELESDYYNFTGLNIPPYHPARDMQDTFYIKNHAHLVMRTHTSPIQVRGPRKYGVPLRVIVPGKCFRNEATDARHEHTFYQLDGVVIDKGISFAHMKGVLEAVAKHLYGNETRARLRPKLYPFVEPGVNGEVTCFLCRGEGCGICKKTGWLEIFGAGPMHPNVLKAGGVDPDEYQGFAFGLGLDRLAILKYNIEDIRHFHSGDLRFLEQF